MTILCANGCHVYTVGSLRCQCGAAANGYPFPAGYNPFGPPRPPTPPTAGQGADVSIKVFEAAQRAGASHLSMDGKRIYCERLGATLEAEWDGNGWGCWWLCQGLPPDAVKM